MRDDWFVRVQGKEYGPVSSDTLREWRSEGRLIATNELRRVGEQRWIAADQLVELFPDEAAPAAVIEEQGPKPKSGREILADTARIYWAGLPRFICLGLLTAIPMFVLQLTLPRLPLPSLTAPTTAVEMPALPPTSIAMFVLLLLAWPISSAGMQLVADDILHRRPRSFIGQFRAALGLWSRMLAVTLLVYGSYFFWLFAPFAAMIALVSGETVSVIGLLLVLPIGAFAVYINARLFINFLFWQQTAALTNANPFDAVRESKRLARCASTAPRMQRPLYRGALVASVWLLLALALTVVAQLPFVAARFAGVSSPDEAMRLAEALSQAKSPDRLMLMADAVTGIVHLLLRPLLAASFLSLFYDARARAGVRPD